jgi:hypothetical protein
MFLNEEFLRIYEELSDINDNLNESNFDNEEVYGEAAKTIPGLLRYFVAHIETLAAVIERERILASNGESKKPSNDKINGKKLPFVSFSHQLFSHAYRRGSSWKYGVVVDQKKLEQKVETLVNTNIEDNYVHENKSSRVFGATRLANGAEIIMTSYGQFEIDLDDSKRKVLGDIPKTGYYEKVKASFNTRLKAEQAKYADGHAKSVTAESFSCTESPEVIQKYLKTDVDVLEGFLLIDRRQATGVRFTDVCSDVPGLFDYLHDHTTLNEGELRVWLPKGEKYLDISGCIIGIVLPSNYKENNYDNEQNTAPDVMWLRKLVKEQDLTIYVYQSKEESNIPNIDLSKKQVRTLKRPSIMEYFHKITSSREAVIDFIWNELTKYKVDHDHSSAYNKVMASKTSVASMLDVLQNTKYNYPAFLEAISEYGLTKKDIKSIYQTGQPLPDAKSIFGVKTADAEAVIKFLQHLAQQYPNKILCNAYTAWFAANTNATMLNTNKLVPEEADWRHFMDTCKQRFNYSMFDLSKLSRGEITSVNREPIKTLFKKAAKTNKKTTLAFIKNFANEFATYSLAGAYRAYMGKYAVDTNALSINNTNYSYQLWLEKVTDSEGPIKLTKEEVLNYFNEYKAEATNNN